MSIVGFKTEDQINADNKDRAYKEYKGYIFDIKGNMIRVNDKYDLLLSIDNNYLCSCSDFVYRSPHYTKYYCKHIYSYLFYLAARGIDVTI